MNSETKDYLGWIIPVVAILLAVYSATETADRFSLSIAASVILVALNERRRTKILTAAMVRVVDEKGSVRGLIGYADEGVQIGVIAEPLYNGAIAYAGLWQKIPSASFTFKSTASATSHEHIERSPTLSVAGEMAQQFRSYSINFSYATANNEPSLTVEEYHKDGVLVRHITLS